MSVEKKLFALDYIVERVRDWYTDAGGNFHVNDLSKLKITKLLFFVCAVSSSRETPGLLRTFNNFAALPFGHVESDIQDHMERSTHFLITKAGLAYKPDIVSYEINHDIDDIIPDIDAAIERLKLINYDLVMYDPFKLVDLSHRWQSWKTVFSLAKRNGKFSMKIPQEMIMVEPKIFR